MAILQMNQIKIGSPSGWQAGLPPIQPKQRCLDSSGQLRINHKSCQTYRAYRLAAVSVMLTVFVLQFVFLQGVTADCGNDVKCIQALVCLSFAHLSFYQSTDMFVALQQQISQHSAMLTR